MSSLANFVFHRTYKFLVMCLLKYERNKIALSMHKYIVTMDNMLPQNEFPTV